MGTRSVKGMALAAYRAVFDARNVVYLALALSSVLLYSAMYPPVELGFLAWVALVPWLTMVTSAPRVRRVVVSYLAGVAFFFMNLWWIAPVTIPGYVSMSMFLGLYWAVGGWSIARLNQACGVPLTVAAPLAWTGLEFLRSFLLTGFPWFFLGHSQVKVLPLIQVADLVGTYGVTFLVATVNGLFADLLVSVRDGTWRLRRAAGRTLVVLAVLAAAWGYGLWRLGQDTLYQGPRVAVVQEDFPLRVNDDGPGVGEALGSLLRLSDKAAEQRPALVVWPETSVGVSVNPEYLDAVPTDDRMSSWQNLGRQARVLLTDFAKQARVYLVVGAISKEVNGPDRYPEVDRYNSALVYGPDGDLAGRYDKIHLVLFGECVPFRYTIPRLYRFLNENMTPYGQGGFEYSLTPGRRLERFTLPADGKEYRYAVAICYEDVMAYLIRRFTRAPGGRKGIDFLVNISNDGWFNHSCELPQHLYICAFRAVENRIGVARAVNTGISGFISPTGRIEVMVRDGSYAPGNRDVLVRPVTLDRRVSFYSRHGDWFAIMCLALTAVTLPDWGRFRRRPGPSNGKTTG